MKYHHKEIEAKWQKYWAENNIFRAENNSEKPKFYVLDMFPYPSGAGLHVGHPLGYIASDIYARYMRHKGYNVLHPMGYDSFGLPAEQYAIETGQHPAVTTKRNIDTYRRQMDQIGFSFDWSREIRTSDPAYFKHTQWIFLQLFHSYYDLTQDKALPVSRLVEAFEKEGNKNISAVCDSDTPAFDAKMWKSFDEKQKQEILMHYRLTYLADTMVNWCPALGTVLANDEVINGRSERGNHPVIQKKMKQWMMRISAYADRLLADLDLLDWPGNIKEIQRNWIGKSRGASIVFPIQDTAEKIEVFTTRPDTLFGVTFMVLAPEHEIIDRITDPAYREQVEAYRRQAAHKTERERQADTKNKTGQFTGAYCLHPFTGDPIPVWISDYVLAGYGTGAIMAVPAGDQRDYDFAVQMGIPIVNIFEGHDIGTGANENKEAVLTHSDFLDGLKAGEAIDKMIQALEEKGIGKARTNYRLRDAVFSRQRYWGEPFPVYYKQGIPYPIDETFLPLTLPEVKEYKPTEDGKPPLGNAGHWAWDARNNKVVSNDLISDADEIYPLELNTMPGWAGSSWYFNRYMDPHNDAEFASQEALEYWKQVDLYIGGSEHATGHLLYSRFWQKFLYDRGYVPVPEYSVKLINQGMILGTSAFVHRLAGSAGTFVSADIAGDYDTHKIHVPVSMVNLSDELDTEAFGKWRDEYRSATFITNADGKVKVSREVEKMSKSKYNVVNPDDICEEYGADTLRMYEMFLGPIDQAKPWNTAGITGVYNFLKKLWKLYHQGSGGQFLMEDTPASKECLKTLHRTIKKLRDDIEQFSFNTGVSALMIAVNEWTSSKCRSREILEPLIVLIEPYAPHIAEELWYKAGHRDSVSREPYPEYDEKYLIEQTKTYPISFNGKVRFTLELPLDMSKDDIEKTVMAHERTRKQLQGRTPKKIIVVPGRIVNIVG